MAAFLGMRGTGDWITDARPKNWREGILLLFPNGDMPVTAVLSKGASEKTDDPEFSWFSKNLETQSGAITGVYTNPGLSSAASGAITVGTTLYIKMAEATADHFRAGHTALAIDQDVKTRTAHFRVDGVVKAGASSYIAGKLLVALDTGIINNVDTVDVVGNSNPEGGIIPEAVGYDPTKFNNFTQIFRTSLDITRTAKKTKLRTGDAYAEMKREALQYHGIEMEQAILFGAKAELTGVNGKPERHTQGMFEFLKVNNPDNILNYQTAGAGPWLSGGENWLDDALELLMREGTGELMAVCGNGALRGIQKIAKASGEFQLTSETAAYGVKVVRWTTPFGDILLKRHPLFSKKEYRHNDIMLYRPQNVRYRFIDDTTFLPDNNVNSSGHQKIDGQKEEWLTECGFEFHHPTTFMYLAGVGLNP